jgi:RNA polymerase sigma-70 factor (ECF subfamily)
VEVARFGGARPDGDDEALIERIRRRDADAFRILYARHARYLAGVILRLLGADAEMEDVLQECFVEAVRSIDGLQDAGSLRRWLVTIAVRRVRRTLAARSRRRWIASAFSLVAPRALAPAGEWSVSELQAALDSLPPKLRVPWMLRRVEELEFEEVAAGCSISVSTAKRRVATAEERLGRWFHAR